MKQMTKRSVSLLLIMITLISLFSIVPISTNAATNASLENLRNFTTNSQMPWLDEQAGYFGVTISGTSTNLRTICINPDKDRPTGARTWERIYSAQEKARTLNRVTLRKLLYYGFDGPGANMVIKLPEGVTINGEKTCDVDTYIAYMYSKYRVNVYDATQTLHNGEYGAPNNSVTQSNISMTNYNGAFLRWLSVAWWMKNCSDDESTTNTWITQLGKLESFYGISASTASKKVDEHCYANREAILNHIKIISTLPEAPPVDIWKSNVPSGYENTQQLMTYKFFVRVAVPKNTTFNEVDHSGTDTYGIKYELIDSTNPNDKKTIQINTPQNHYEDTNWGVYGWSNANNHDSPTAVIKSGKSYACDDHDAGQLFEQQKTMKVTESVTNNLYKKDDTEYTCRYFCRDSLGYGVLMPDAIVKADQNIASIQNPIADNDTIRTETKYQAAMQFPADIPYIKLQMRKEASAESPKTIQGAVYGLSTQENATFETFRNSSCKITIDQDGYGTWGTGDGTNNNSSDEIYRNKNSGASAEGQKWYAREIIAPKGYELDPTVYTFKNSGERDSKNVPIFRLCKNDQIVSSTETPIMKLQLGKVSEDTNVTNNNQCYELNGAEFKIYYKDTNESTYHDTGMTITTDKTGYGCVTDANDTGINNDTSDLPLYKNKKSGKSIQMIANREYFAKETKAPKGFITYENTYFKFTYVNKNDSNGIPIYRISNEHAYDANGNENNAEISEAWKNYKDGLSEKIKGDPIGISIRKTGSNTTLPTEGAIFKVSYYAVEATNNDKIYRQNQVEGATPVSHRTDIINSGKTPARTWYIETKKDADTNEYKAELDAEHLAQGYNSGSFYYDSKNNIYIPLGIISIEEIKAPKGFKKTTDILYININETPLPDSTTILNPLTDEGREEYAEALSFDITNRTASGYAGIVKVDDNNNRVPNAQYRLYDTEAKAKAVQNGYASPDTYAKGRLTTTTNPLGDVFLHPSTGTPVQLNVGTTYYAIETEVPPASQGHYAIDKTIHKLKITTNNMSTSENPTVAEALQVMCKATSKETDDAKGNLKVIKTSNEKMIPYNEEAKTYNQHNGDTHYESFTMDARLPDIWFAVYAVDTRTENPFNGKIATKEAIAIGKTDENGEIQFDGLPVNKHGTTSKQLYLVKELGYNVEFEPNKNEKKFEALPYKWSIKKENCLQTNGMYFEGLTNDVFTIETLDGKPEWNQAVKTRYFYGNPEEARANENGKIVELIENETNDATQEIEFHNTIPDTNIEISKKSYNDLTTDITTCGIAYRVYTDFDDKRYASNSIGSVTSVYGHNTNLEEILHSNMNNGPLMHLPACQLLPNTSICIPITYKIEEKGIYWHSDMTMYTFEHLQQGYGEPIYEGIQEADVNYKENNEGTPLLDYTITNTPKTYNVNITKTAEDSDESSNALSQWFEIKGVITDISLRSHNDDTPVSSELDKIIKNLPHDYSAKYEEMYELTQINKSSNPDDYEWIVIHSDNGLYYDFTNSETEEILYKDGDAPRQILYNNLTDASCAVPIEYMRTPTLGYTKYGHHVKQINIKTNAEGNATVFEKDSNGITHVTKDAQVLALVPVERGSGRIVIQNETLPPSTEFVSYHNVNSQHIDYRYVDVNHTPAIYYKSDIYDYRMAYANNDEASSVKPIEGFCPHNLETSYDITSPTKSTTSLMTVLRVKELGDLTGGRYDSFLINEKYKTPDIQWVEPFTKNNVHLDFDNVLNRINIKLHKKNDSNQALPNASWVLLERNAKENKYYPVIVQAQTTIVGDTNKITYTYVGQNTTEDIYETITQDGETTERIIPAINLMTDDNGDIEIKGIPYEKRLKLREVKPPLGYMPYGKDISLNTGARSLNNLINQGVITVDDEGTYIVNYEVTDSANIMPNTGGTGPVAAVATAILFAIPTAIFAIMYNRRKKNRKIR